MESYSKWSPVFGIFFDTRHSSCFEHHSCCCMCQQFVLLLLSISIYEHVYAFTSDGHFGTFVFWLLWTKLFCTFVYMYFGGHMIFVLGKYGGLYGRYMFHCIQNWQTIVQHDFTILYFLQYFIFLISFKSRRC